LSYTNILTNVKTILDSVTGIGKTHDYFRFSDNLEHHGAELFYSNKIFHTWFITRVNFIANSLVHYQVERFHNFDLWGFYQISDKDASEKTFQALCDAICDKFDEDSNIVMDANSDQPEPAELQEFELAVEFMGILCHRAKIRIQVFEEYDGTA